MYACMHICTYVCMYVGMYVRTCECMYVRIYLCMLSNANEINILSISVSIWPSRPWIKEIIQYYVRHILNLGKIVILAWWKGIIVSAILHANLTLSCCLAKTYTESQFGSYRFTTKYVSMSRPYYKAILHYTYHINISKIFDVHGFIVIWALKK